MRKQFAALLFRHPARRLCSSTPLPAAALRALGLHPHATIGDARQAHRALAMQLHPDLSRSSAGSLEEQLRRATALVTANIAREAIEQAAISGPQTQSFSGASTKRIHAMAVAGNVDGVLDALAFGVDPNVPTPAHGAPPIFYATCMSFLGPPSTAGDEARCRVLELLASTPGVDLSLVGTSSWADGETVYSLAGKGRCPELALAALDRGLSQRKFVRVSGGV